MGPKMWRICLARVCTIRTVLNGKRSNDAAALVQSNSLCERQAVHTVHDMLMRALFCLV
jgi:hypothetical protein